MSALHSGSRPKEGVNLAQVGDFEIWHLVHLSDYPWCALKLCAAPGLRLPKANYRVGWNVEEKRVTANKDGKRLYQLDRRVYEQLHYVCQRMIDPDSIPRKERPLVAGRKELQTLRAELCSVIARLDNIMQGCKR